MEQQGGNIENSWKPGGAEAAQIFNQGLAPLDPNNYLANSMAALNAGNPYTSQIAGFSPNNPALAGLSNFNASNPYTSQIGSYNTANQGLAGLQNFDSTNSSISGYDQFLSGTNPYADQLFDISANQIQDQINSQFGSSGQGSSSGNLNEQISQLGDYGAQFYGGIYDSDMNRALEATTGAVNATQAQNELGLAGLTGYSTGTQAQNQLGLDALGTAQSGWGDSTMANLSAQQAATTAYGNQDQQSLDAQIAAAAAQQNATNATASFLPGMLSQAQMEPYNNLSAYTDIVSRLTGTSPQTAEASSSGWDKLIGLGTMAGGLSGFFP